MQLLLLALVFVGPPQSQLTISDTVTTICYQKPIGVQAQDAGYAFEGSLGLNQNFFTDEITDLATDEIWVIGVAAVPDSFTLVQAQLLLARAGWQFATLRQSLAYVEQTGRYKLNFPLVIDQDLCSREESLPCHALLCSCSGRHVFAHTEITPWDRKRFMVRRFVR